MIDLRFDMVLRALSTRGKDPPPPSTSQQQAAVALVEAGADVIAPSDMMDGRIGVIRENARDCHVENGVFIRIGTFVNRHRRIVDALDGDDHRG